MAQKDETAWQRELIIYHNNKISITALERGGFTG